MWPGKLVKTWEEHGGSLKCCPKIAVKEFIWKKSYWQVSKKIVRWEGDIKNQTRTCSLSVKYIQSIVKLL